MLRPPLRPRTTPGAGRYRRQRRGRVAAALILAIGLAGLSGCAADGGGLELVPVPAGADEGEPIQAYLLAVEARLDPAEMKEMALLPERARGLDVPPRLSVQVSLPLPIDDPFHEVLSLVVEVDGDVRCEEVDADGQRRLFVNFPPDAFPELVSWRARINRRQEPQPALPRLPAQLEQELGGQARLEDVERLVEDQGLRVRRVDGLELGASGAMERRWLEVELDQRWVPCSPASDGEGWRAGLGAEFVRLGERPTALTQSLPNTDPTALKLDVRYDLEELD